jgi:hypothetical protein
VVVITSPYVSQGFTLGYESRPMAYLSQGFTLGYKNKPMA